MKEKIYLIDLTPNIKILSDKVFHVSYQLNNGEIIDGQFRRVILKGEIVWMLLLNSWKYVKMKIYRKTLRKLCDGVITEFCYKFDLEIKKILVNHFSIIVPQSK
ncbi:hypothetical protein ABES25_01395 [Bacillus gobiensis]|uniref:hypothetical protein n=1 Tax=Bacillus gobiensis TaxID=1441095 RepID=UPI003D229037